MCHEVTIAQTYVLLKPSPEHLCSERGTEHMLVDLRNLLY